MTPYPIFLRLEGRRCVIVGGGPIGLRKATGLLESGALVTVVSPAFETAFTELAASCSGLTLVERRFEAGDISGALLVFACTADRAVQVLVTEAAGEAGVLVCRTDEAAESDFYGASVLRRGDLAVAVGTAGRSPALAGFVRRQLEADLGAHYGDVLDLMAAFRERLGGPSGVALTAETIGRMCRAALDRGLLTAVRDGDDQRAERILAEVESLG